MRYAGQESWQIREDRWIQHFEWALWIRAAERIDAPAGGIVPGPLLIDPLPAPSPGLDLAALSEQWLAWWRVLCDLPEWSPADGGSPPVFAHSGPDFDGLAGQRLLREVLRHRWLEAHQWHSERKRAGVENRAFTRGPQASSVVAEVERANGRTARPFVLTIDVLPVADQKIRAISETRFLVPEGVRDGADWAQVLRGLVEPLA
ncbi:MAG TPA: hypothetical protein VGN81_06950 [Pseudonocardiaceae bacterium]